MISGICAAAALLATGTWLVRLATPALPSGFVETAQRLALGFVFGVGACSCAFAVVLFSRGLGASPDSGNAVLLAVALLILVNQKRSLTRLCSKLSKPADRLVVLGFGCAALAAVAIFIEHVVRHPEGGWDATMIWILRARDLFAGRTLAVALPAEQTWSHPDYPLLLPGALAELWTIQGHWGQAAPIALAAIYAICTVVLLVSAVGQRVGLNVGLFAGTLLLATPSFAMEASTREADVPLAAELLVAVLLASEALRCHDLAQRSRLLLGAGLACGLAAWTKNEGVVFSLAMFFCLLARRPTADGARDAAAFALGCAPVALLIFFFKTQLAPPNDLFVGNVWSRLWRPARFGELVWLMVRRLVLFQVWGLTLVSAIVATGWLWWKPARRPTTDRPLWQTLASAVIGVALIYQVSPHDLGWHVRSSIDREFLQLWPSLLFLLFSSGQFSL